MQIKKLIKILMEAEDKERDIFIPDMTYAENGEVVHSTSNTIGHSFDDNNDLELYVVDEEV